MNNHFVKLNDGWKPKPNVPASLLRYSWLFILFALLSLVACGGGSSSGSGGGGGGGGVNSPPNYPGNRTGFVRTGDNPNSAVYDSLHNVVFVSEPTLGIVDAISVSNQQIKARIFVPGVNALGITPDNTKVLASTERQVAWIDTSLLRVIQWQVLPQVNDPFSGEQYFVPFNYFFVHVGPPFASYNLVMLANGKVLFEALEGGFTQILVEWDPVSNTAIWLSGGAAGAPVPFGGPIATSANGSEVVFASGPTIYDSATNQFRTSSTFPGGAALVAANPTGTQFALLIASSITFIDAQFNILGKVSGGANGMAYSADGKYLYIATGGSIPGLTTIDARSYTILGSAPDYYDAIGAEFPIGADNTGLIFGAAFGGLVLSDATNFQTFSSNPLEPPWNGFINPSEGPTQGGTSTTLTVGLPGKLPDVWFGLQLATSETLTAVGVQATDPAAKSVGTVNVKLVEPDGTMDVIPQAFTYGAIPLSPAPLAATPGGGAAADIIGFGLGADISGALPQVTIGGATAKVVSSTQASGIPQQDLTVTVPPGSPGAVDIVVTSPSGTGTLLKGFHYLNSVTDYPTKDTMKSVLYDQQRQQLYLNAGDHIDVFSLNQKTYTTSIIPPSLGGTRQLTAMALTPDSSKLLVGNYSDDSLAIINPENPANATAVQIFPATPGSYQLAPYSIAATSKNTVFISGAASNVTGGGGALYELNLGTLVATQRTDPTIADLQIAGELLAASKSGSQAYMATPDDSGGYVMGWSAATDAWASHNLGSLVASIFYADAAASRDGNVFSMSMDLSVSDFPYPMMVDSQLNQFSQLGIESIFSAANLNGNALHDSGSLLYSSTGYGVDLIDVKHGALAERILLSEQDAFLDGSLAVDETGQKIFLITNAGLTVIELDSVPLSIGSITPSAGSIGTLIKIRGSGFNTGTSVAFNGTIATTTFVDEDTIVVSVPAITTGAAQIVISNSDESSYTLDSAFTVQ